MALDIMSTTSTYIQLGKLNESDDRHERTSQDSQVDVHGRVFFQNPSLNNAPLQNNVPKENGFRSAAAVRQQGRDQRLQEPKQSALLLRGFREEYALVTDHDIPSVQQRGEILIKVAAIGLNPIDWKAP